jgi:hypothetical protein
LTLNELLNLYYTTIQDRSRHYITPQKRETGVGAPHMLYMITEMRGGLATWDDKRMHRWLGYLQCLLVTSSYFTLTEIRDQTRNMTHD